MKHSPLEIRHLELGAKMADFGGWQMPIEYPGGGVLTEHQAVREKVGIFDVSHLGKIWIKGSGALDFVNSVITNDLNRISDGQAQYSLLCNETGGVIDDLIVYRFNSSEIFIIPNAANCEKVFEIFKKESPANLELDNAHEKYAVIAVQGPESKKLLESLGISLNLEYMSHGQFKIENIDLIICRTGYSGEHGYELLPKVENALAIWDLLVANGVQVCGLGSRDTLRTEMGYPLHGQDLSPTITPVTAGSSWAVGFEKPNFHGANALRNEKAAGSKQKLRGLKLLDRGIPRSHMKVIEAGTVARVEIGEVTSGTFSPNLKVGIALALINSKYVIGDQVKIDIRGKETAAEIVRLPFVESHVK